MHIPGWIKLLLILFIAFAIAGSSYDSTITVREAFEIIGLAVVLAFVIDTISEWLFRIVVTLFHRE